ncbi:class I SAM-dependent methyltransferase [Ruminiclostridium herbifermentans]|uniref:Class I SAM-dependent methyltransferase n=1 Tax=Ruminiclostridium herbifermentans TaxID=2488810 RepID=A0A4U7JL72_9FIRM|nr:class I SAM-dependent methyltransferase [Ruminiclostridium herbifermentans]QNU65977.1 class I SAM-dependent methyltransferase [Ruminiclostridium herbifermentans]
MGFYEQISQYYDYIFPTGNEQVRFIKEVAGKPPKTILDIACGTGGYSLELAKQGYELTASDIDAEMVRQLRIKSETVGKPIESIQANMLDLESKIFCKFDVVFCIGNSIVHLKNLEQIKSFICSTHNLLNTGGSLILQIINFDRVLLKNIKSLPTITDESIGLTFERNYSYNKQQHSIYFNTKLTVDNKSFENEIPLYPLLEEELLQAVTDAGFKNVNLFGDFAGNAFDKYNSFMLVLWAR